MPRFFVRQERISDGYISIIGEDAHHIARSLRMAAGEEITEIFKTRGEAEFRDMETEAVRRAATATARVIATGGGAILRDANVEALKQNGRLFFLDRPVEKLIPTDTRPLASDIDALRQRYSERYSRYLAVCDERIDCDRAAEAVAEIIGEKYR